MQKRYRPKWSSTTSPLAAGAIRSIGLATLVALTSSRAQASGFLFPRFGGDYGHPAIASPYAVYFNPAAVGGARGTQVTVDGLGALRVSQYERPASALSPSGSQNVNDPTYVAANTGKNSLSNLQGAPFIGITTDFGGTPFFAGFATYVPMGGIVKWKSNDAFADSASPPGAVDGPQRWAVISGKQISIWNTLALGATCTRYHLSVAFSFSVVHDNVEHLLARNLDSTDDVLTPNLRPKEGRSFLSVAGTNIALGGGIYWEPLDDRRLRVGLSFVSRPALGRMRLSGTLRTQFGNTPEPTTQDADLLQTLPETIRLGAAYRATPKLDLRADAEWIRWSNFQQQCVVAKNADCQIHSDGSENVPAGETTTKVLLNLVRRWHDAFGLRVGAGYLVAPETEVMGSLAVDTSAVPGETHDAIYFDAFKAIASIGVRQQLGARAWIGASYTHMYYFPRDTTSEANTVTLRVPTKTPSPGGRYQQQILLLDVNVTFRF